MEAKTTVHAVDPKGLLIGWGIILAWGLSLAFLLTWENNRKVCGGRLSWKNFGRVWRHFASAVAICRCETQSEALTDTPLFVFCRGGLLQKRFCICICRSVSADTNRLWSCPRTTPKGQLWICSRGKGFLQIATADRRSQRRLGLHNRPLPPASEPAEGPSSPLQNGFYADTDRCRFPTAICVWLPPT